MLSQCCLRRPPAPTRTSRSFQDSAAAHLPLLRWPRRRRPSCVAPPRRPHRRCACQTLRAPTRHVRAADHTPSAARHERRRPSRHRPASPRPASGSLRTTACDESRRQRAFQHQHVGRQHAPPLRPKPARFAPAPRSNRAHRIDGMGGVRECCPAPPARPPPRADSAPVWVASCACSCFYETPCPAQAYAIAVRWRGPPGQSRRARLMAAAHP